MNRKMFETYCWEHGWELFHTEGYLCVEKDWSNGYGTQISYKFEVGMNLTKMLNEMKEEDGYTEATQGEFPFVNAGELPM